VKRSKLLTVAHQRTPKKTEERFDDKQQKIKERKLNQIGIKIMTKCKTRQTRKALMKTQRHLLKL